MRIGIDARLWNESGVGRYIRNLVRELQIIDKKNDYILFALKKDRENVQFQISNFKFQIITADIRWHSLEEQILLPSILSHSVLDLVHFPYFSVPVLYNKPYVVTIHDLILHHFPTGEASTLPRPLYKLKLVGYKFVISQAAKKAEKILAVSETTRQEIIDHLGVVESKVVVTYEGVDSKIRNPTLRLPFGFAQGGRSGREFEIRNIGKWKMGNGNYFLYVGNAYPHKNLARLLEAFKLVRDSSPSAQNDIRLVFVGKKDYFYTKLEKKVKDIKLDENVVFFGEASDTELSFLYKNALAIVSPSLMEGFGLPLLEAMANKCLVLASDIPVHREICEDSAVYFNPNDVNDIAKSLQQLLLNDSNHFTDQIRKGVERTKEFSWKKMAEQTLEIYESCSSLGSE